MTDLHGLTYGGLTLVELATQSLTKPEDFGWWGDEDMFVSWGFAGIDKNNSSSLLDICNFDCVADHLRFLFPDDFHVVGIKHWAVGSLDRLTVRVLIDASKGIVAGNITESFEEVVKIGFQLREDYPIFDDDAYSLALHSEARLWVENSIPSCVLIKDSVGYTADVLLSWFYENDYDVDEIVSSMLSFSEEMMIVAAYDLGLIDPSYREEWDDYADRYSLGTILWNEYGNVAMPLDGQLDIFGNAFVREKRNG